MTLYAQHDIEHDGASYAPGAPVPFTADELAQHARGEAGPIAALVKVGAVAATPPKIAGPPKVAFTVIEHDRAGLGPLAGPYSETTGVDAFRI